MRSLTPRFPLFFFLLTTSLLISSCSEQTSLETIVNEIIEQAEATFENHNSRELRKLISVDYHDSSARDFQDIIAFSNAYMLRAKSIHLFADLESAILVDDLIEARILVAFAAKPVTERKTLPQLKADIYWFNIILTDKDGNWKIISASWQQTMLDDFVNK